MRFSEVAAKAAGDIEFSREIQAAAVRAATEGVESDAWVELARYFAEDDGELSLLIPVIDNTAAGQLNTEQTSTLLLGTQTSGISGTTNTQTTTTTTSRLCTIPGICPRANALPAPAAAAAAELKKTQTEQSKYKRR